MKSKNKLHYFLLYTAILLAIIGIFSPLLPKILIGKHQLSDLALIGDWWGGTSAVFIAFSGIIFLILNYLMQKDELDLTRKELKIQRFETVFFNLLNIRQKLIENTVVVDKNSEKNYGYFAIKLLRIELYNSYPYGSTNPNDLNSEILLIKELFRIFTEQKGKYINDFFNNFKSIMKYIDKHIELNDINKQFYFDLLFSQLSTDEILLLFYLGESWGILEFKPFFNKYKVFKDINIHNLIKPEHKGFYSYLSKKSINEYYC